MRSSGRSTSSGGASRTSSPTRPSTFFSAANDATDAAHDPRVYYAALIDVITKASGEGRRVVLSPPFPIAGDAEVQARIAGYAAQVERIWTEGHAERGAPLWGNPPELHDGVHPTQAGQDHIATLLRPILAPEPAAAHLVLFGLLMLRARPRRPAEHPAASGPQTQGERADRSGVA